jgi:hypothetical protein
MWLRSWPSLLLCAGVLYLQNDLLVLSILGNGALCVVVSRSENAIAEGVDFSG